MNRWTERGYCLLPFILFYAFYLSVIIFGSGWSDLLDLLIVFLALVTIDVILFGIGKYKTHLETLEEKSRVEKEKKKDNVDDDSRKRDRFDQIEEYFHNFEASLIVVKEDTINVEPADLENVEEDDDDDDYVDDEDDDYENDDYEDDEDEDEDEDDDYEDDEDEGNDDDE
jgi:hypothetical protein